MKPTLLNDDEADPRLITWVDLIREKRRTTKFANNYFNFVQFHVARDASLVNQPSNLWPLISCLWTGTNSGVRVSKGGR